MAGFWSGLVEGQKARASQDMTLAKIAEWNRLKDLREKQTQFDMADLDSKMQLLPVETQAAIAKNQAIMQELPSQLSLNQLKRGAEGLQAADTLNNFASDQALKRKTNQLAYDQAAQKPVNKGVFNADLGGFVYEPTAQNPNGVFVPVAGARKETKPEKPTEGNNASWGYANRMIEADKVLSGIGDKYSPTAIASKNWYQELPNLLGGVTNGLANAALDSNDQMAEQAQRNFINAVLRRESGASIAPSEFDSARRQYFPEAGDTPEVLKQKRAARLQAIQQLAVGAGPLASSLPSVDTGQDVDIDALIKKYGG